MSGLLTRAQVAERIGASIATVRRLEGNGLTPHVGSDGTHRFHPKEVTAFAASRANAAIGRGKIRNPTPPPEARTRGGELAALVFERFEQRQSQAEIVIGLRIEAGDGPRALRSVVASVSSRDSSGKRAPNVPLEEDIESAHDSPGLDPAARGVARRGTHAHQSRPLAGSVPRRRRPRRLCVARRTRRVPDRLRVHASSWRSHAASALATSASTLTASTPPGSAGWCWFRSYLAAERSPLPRYRRGVSAIRAHVKDGRNCRGRADRVAGRQ